VVVLLRFVVVYSLFDMATIIFCGALRGAGDTRFVMAATFGLGIGIMAIPSYVAIEFFAGGVLTAWSFMTLYVLALGISFLLRFRGGAWRSMRVIESAIGEEEVVAAAALRATPSQ
jgi:MATE family multidrug resistance protein